MSLLEISNKAKKVRKLYEALETQKYGRSWSTEEIALGFVGDVGDLAKLFQAHEGVRDIVIWGYRSVMHDAIHDDGDISSETQRVTVGGDRPS